MPSVYDVDKRVELSSVPNWEEIILWYHDTHVRRSLILSLKYVSSWTTLPALPRHKGPKEQIIAGVYRYITKDVRYSYMPFRQSGYVLQKANVINTRHRRLQGCCYGRIAMLAERDITSPTHGKRRHLHFNASPLPSIPFDHGSVAILETQCRQSSGSHTADNVPIGSIPHADLKGFSLGVRPGLREPM
ncbi:MAG: hypothetical protein IPF59_09600 [Ignavibacteria bacterium]|nr:hypothetical protein [Ignavibacteria bacterium]